MIFLTKIININNFFFRQAGSVSSLGLENDRHQNNLQHQQPQLPYLNEMEWKLKMANYDSLTALKNSAAANLNSSNGHKSPMDALIDDVSSVAKRLNNIPLDVADLRIAEEHCGSQSPPKPSALRDSASPEDRTKKRVQFCDQNSATSSLERRDEEEPRVQTLGSQEVYNDPRQRRLANLQATKSLKPVVSHFFNF